MGTRQLFALSKNNCEVWFDPVDSHVATHFKDTPELRRLVQTIVEQTVLLDAAVRFQTDMGRVVGVSDLVATDETDHIVFATRKNRDRPIRFTKSRRPQPCSLVTVVLNRLPPEESGDYDLFTAWIGPDMPPFPGNEGERPESQAFWENHALAWGTQEIVSGSETTTPPWA